MSILKDKLKNKEISDTKYNSIINGAKKLYKIDDKVDFLKKNL
jgi:hypothetical protein